MAFVKMMLICLSLLIVGVAAAQNFDSLHHMSHSAEGNWVELQGENSVMVPNLTLARPAVSWTYPYAVHPIYQQNQTISGTFFGARDLADCTVKVLAAKLHFSSFMGAVNVLDGPVTIADTYGTFGARQLNATGDASFAIPGMPCGIYSLYVIDENSSTVLSASPFLVTETEIEVETPSEISAGDLLPVNVELELENGSDGRPLVFGAFIVSAWDYRGLSLEITGDGTINGTSIGAAWNENAIVIQGDFHPSWDLLARLLMIFPENSAAAMQDSLDGDVELYMITDDSWEPGNYVLTCCVISEGTVVGLDQTEVAIA
jgi:methanogen extracellular protein (TIGR04279 family)